MSETQVSNRYCVRANEVAGYYPANHAGTLNCRLIGPETELRGEQWRCHRPHPGKEAKHYKVEEVRELLERVGELP